MTRKKELVRVNAAGLSSCHVVLTGFLSSLLSRLQAEEDGDLEAADELNECLRELEQRMLTAGSASGASYGMMSAGGPWTSPGSQMFGMPQPKRPLQEVQESDIARVISRWTGIPVTKLVRAMACH